MANASENSSRLVTAVHGLREAMPHPAYELGLSSFLRKQHSDDACYEILERLETGDGTFDFLMRPGIWCARTEAFGKGVRIGAPSYASTLESTTWYSLALKPIFRGTPSSLKNWRTLVPAPPHFWGAARGKARSWSRDRSTKDVPDFAIAPFFAGNMNGMPKD